MEKTIPSMVLNAQYKYAMARDKIKPGVKVEADITADGEVGKAKYRVLQLFEHCFLTESIAGKARILRCFLFSDVMTGAIRVV